MNNCTTIPCFESGDLIEHTTYIALIEEDEVNGAHLDDVIDQDEQYDYYHSDHGEHHDDDDYQDVDWIMGI